MHLELYFDRGNSIKFTTLVRELEPAGVLLQNKVPSSSLVLDILKISYLTAL